VERKLEEKKKRRKQKLKESYFLSLVWIIKKYKKKVTFQQTIFPLFGTRKIDQEKKT